MWPLCKFIRKRSFLPLFLSDIDTKQNLHKYCGQGLCYRKLLVLVTQACHHVQRCRREVALWRCLYPSSDDKHENSQKGLLQSSRMNEVKPILFLDLAIVFWKGHRILLVSSLIRCQCALRVFNLIVQDKVEELALKRWESSQLLCISFFKNMYIQIHVTIQ